jgi:predicted nucleic acid-binding protein
MLKRGRITLDQVKIALNEYKKIPIKFHDPDLNLVLELCLDFNLYAYDAYFLQCAIDLRAPLLTLDKQMSENAVKIDIDIIEVIK